MKRSMNRFLFVIAISVFLATSTSAQGTAADYERANGLKAKYESAVIDIAGTPAWIGNTHKLWYRKLTYGDHKRYDFFVRHLLGVKPPPWNQAGNASSSQSSSR